MFPVLQIQLWAWQTKKPNRVFKVSEAVTGRQREASASDRRSSRTSASFVA